MTMTPSDAVGRSRHAGDDTPPTLEASVTRGGLRKAYQRPRIEKYGTLARLTRTGDGTIPDGGSMFGFSGAAG